MAGTRFHLELTVPAGTPALFLNGLSPTPTSIPGLLLARGLHYRIDSVEDLGNGGYWAIHATVVPELGPRSTLGPDQAAPPAPEQQPQTAGHRVAPDPRAAAWPEAPQQKPSSAAQSAQQSVPPASASASASGVDDVPSPVEQHTTAWRDHYEVNLISAAGVTDRGGQPGARHSVNEDFFTLTTAEVGGDQWTLAAVADGLSGQGHSDEASQAATEAAAPILHEEAARVAHGGRPDPKGTAERAFQAAERAVQRLISEKYSDSEIPPATTFVVTIATPTQLVTVARGDSPAFWIPNGDGPAVPLIPDDPYLVEMAQSLGMTVHALQHAAFGASLNHYLGRDTESGELEPHVYDLPAGSGTVVLVTDGAVNIYYKDQSSTESPEQRIADTFRQKLAESSGNLIAASRAFVQHAIDAGEHDNVTAVLIGSPSRETGPAKSAHPATERNDEPALTPPNPGQRSNTPSDADTPRQEDAVATGAPTSAPKGYRGNNSDILGQSTWRNSPDARGKTMGSDGFLTFHTPPGDVPGVGRGRPGPTSADSTESPANATSDAASAEPARTQPDADANPSAQSPRGELVVAAVPHEELTALFASYGDTDSGWTGADGTYSRRLPDGRHLWMFSDVFLGGTKNPDGSRRRPPYLVNNAFVVQSDGEMSTVHHGTTDSPRPLMQAGKGEFYWLGGGYVAGNVLSVMFIRFARNGRGVLNATFEDNLLARFDADDLSLIDTTPMPSTTGVAWSAWLDNDGTHTYVYGCEDLGADKYMHVARVLGDDLRGQWEYFDGSGWSTNENDSARVMSGVANEYSVTRWRGRYLLITQDTTTPTSPRIVAYVSDSPAGPFTTPTLVYEAPEAGATGSFGDPNVIIYNAHEHPDLRSGDELIVSYNLNSLDFKGVLDDMSKYRPRFVRITLNSGLGSSTATTDSGTPDPAKPSNHRSTAQLEPPTEEASAVSQLPAFPGRPSDAAVELFERILDAEAAGDPRAQELRAEAELVITDDAERAHAERYVGNARRTAALAAELDITQEQLDELMTEELRQAFRGEIVIRVTYSTFRKILADGRFKTLFEVPAKGRLAQLPLAARALLEQELFGHANDLPAELRPVYGRIRSGRRPWVLDGDLPTIREFGDVDIVVAPSERGRTTACVGSPTFTKVIPSSVDDPRPESFGATPSGHDEFGYFGLEGIGRDYDGDRFHNSAHILTQTHGGVRTPHMAFVVFHRDLPDHGMREDMSYAGIPWSHAVDMDTTESDSTVAAGPARQLNTGLEAPRKDGRVLGPMESPQDSGASPDEPATPEQGNTAPTTNHGASEQVGAESDAGQPHEPTTLIESFKRRYLKTEVSIDDGVDPAKAAAFLQTFDRLLEKYPTARIHEIGFTDIGNTIATYEWMVEDSELHTRSIELSAEKMAEWSPETVEYIATQLFADAMVYAGRWRAEIHAIKALREHFAPDGVVDEAAFDSWLREQFNDNCFTNGVLNIRTALRSSFGYVESGKDPRAGDKVLHKLLVDRAEEFRGRQAPVGRALTDAEKRSLDIRNRKAYELEDEFGVRVVGYKILDISEDLVLRHYEMTRKLLTELPGLLANGPDGNPPVVGFWPAGSRGVTSNLTLDGIQYPAHALHISERMAIDPQLFADIMTHMIADGVLVGDSAQEIETVIGHETGHAVFLRSGLADDMEAEYQFIMRELVKLFVQTSKPAELDEFPAWLERELSARSFGDTDLDSSVERILDLHEFYAEAYNARTMHGKLATDAQKLAYSRVMQAYARVKAGSGNASGSSGTGAGTVSTRYFVEPDSRQTSITTIATLNQRHADTVTPASITSTATDSGDTTAVSDQPTARINTTDLESGSPATDSGAVEVPDYV
ncbi:protein phosphatase 2C domain-containing protein, partial [Nocardia vinacea]|uniref:protein phosphatase 2C domain-containing protein n=1 Tax=Nocardia vinacea TaxID=96468 RepID=UPI001FDF11EF